MENQDAIRGDQDAPIPKIVSEHGPRKILIVVCTRNVRPALPLFTIGQQLARRGHSVDVACAYDH
ncbi:hypothetical protein ACO1O0_003332 [Amphichorda felina]